MALTRSDTFVHPTAAVEDGVSIGRGTRVWHHAHIREGASIGEGCILGQNVYVDAGVAIGRRVKLQNNVSVHAGVQLADEVFVGPGAVFTNDRVPRATSPDWAMTPTVVRRGASIGANATLVAGVEVGEWAMVGAGSVVTRSVAAHELVAGNPARRLGWVCRCGAARRGPTEAPVAACPDCQRESPGPPSPLPPTGPRAIRR
ncbi:MAG: N-acetyltransferase [Actinobacteria bacterium]|nr:N-acetyltransferase [Actinomycetota bacterium]